MLFHIFIWLCLQDYLCDDSGEPGGDASEGISKLLELLILGHEVKIICTHNFLNAYMICLRINLVEIQFLKLEFSELASVITVKMYAYTIKKNDINCI